MRFPCFSVSVIFCHFWSSADRNGFNVVSSQRRLRSSSQSASCSSTSSSSLVWGKLLLAVLIGDRCLWQFCGSFIFIIFIINSEPSSCRQKLWAPGLLNLRLNHKFNLNSAASALNLLIISSYELNIKSPAVKFVCLVSFSYCQTEKRRDFFYLNESTSQFWRDSSFSSSVRFWYPARQTAASLGGWWVAPPLQQQQLCCSDAAAVSITYCQAAPTEQILIRGWDV